MKEHAGDLTDRVADHDTGRRVLQVTSLGERAVSERIGYKYLHYISHLRNQPSTSRGNQISEWQLKFDGYLRAEVGSECMSRLWILSIMR
jgi:hypothetical protein